MPLFEDQTEVFIVRIWLERREIPDAAPEWRGMVEHVGSSKRRYVVDLNDILGFIAHYVEQLKKRVTQ